MLKIVAFQRKIIFLLYLTEISEDSSDRSNYALKMGFIYLLLLDNHLSSQSR